MFIRTTEDIARDVIGEKIETIIECLDSKNDGMLAPKLIAIMRCQEVMDELQALRVSIATRPWLNPGQQALRAISDQGMEFEPAETERISASRPDPFEEALKMVRPPACCELEAEAQRVASIRMANQPGSTLGKAV